jgi:hypothetical protein
MYHYACGAILFIAIYLNRKDSRMLSLSFVIGASIFASPPMDSRVAFYLFCIMAELAVLMFALSYKCRASSTIAYICAVMIVAHIGGFVLKGGLPLSPYQVIIKFLEFSQLTALVALSPVLRPTLRNRHATTS